MVGGVNLLNKKKLKAVTKRHSNGFVVGATYCEFEYNLRILAERVFDVSCAFEWVYTE